MSKQAPPDLLVRPMVPADLPEMLDVWVAAWQVAYPKIDFEARRGWAVEHIAGLEQEGALSFVALGEGRILGAVVVDPNTGYLDQIVVATGSQGQGVAGVLLAQARRVSPDGLDLHVNQDNGRAVRFYEKNGFAKVGNDRNARSGSPTYKMSWRP
jgi:putative acetyltransferase